MSRTKQKSTLPKELTVQMLSGELYIFTMADETQLVPEHKYFMTRNLTMKLRPNTRKSYGEKTLSQQKSQENRRSKSTGGELVQLIPGKLVHLTPGSSHTVSICTSSSPGSNNDNVTVPISPSTSYPIDSSKKQCDCSLQLEILREKIKHKRKMTKMAQKHERKMTKMAQKHERKMLKLQQRERSSVEPQPQVQP